MKHDATSAPAAHDLLLRWEAMRSRVVARLCSMGMTEADAEDVFGQALLRAWDRRETLVDTGAAEGWFWQLARRLALDELRRGTRRHALALEEASSMLAQPEPPDDPCACSVRLLDELSPERGALLRAVDMEGEPVRDAAGRAGITPNNASVRLHRARRELRRLLLETCGTTSAAECQDCGCPP